MRELNETPDEVAQREYRLMLDTARMKRLPLLKLMQEALDEGNLAEAEELWPSVLQVIALWKRNEVVTRVMLKAAIRARVRAENKLWVAYVQAEEYDKDFSTLMRENERLRERLRQTK